MQQSEQDITQETIIEDVIPMSSSFKWGEKLQLWKLLRLERIKLQGIQQQLVARAVWHFEEKMNLGVAYLFLNFKAHFNLNLNFVALTKLLLCLWKDKMFRKRIFKQTISMLISANDRFILFSRESNGAFQVHFIHSLVTEVWWPLG